MRTRLMIGAASGVVLLALAGGAAYTYFFSGLRTSPQQLGLQTPSPATSAATTTPSGLAGKWTVASGSQVGYRVKELFVGQTSKHDAVARTTSVTGGFTVAGDATSGYRIATISITADLTGLHSVDQVAGRDVSQRDFFVSRQIDLQQFPSATFVADMAAIPGPVNASKVTVNVPGSLTIHGVTKTVTASIQTQVASGKIEVAGSVTIDMTSFGVTPPQVPFTTVDAQVVIEFDIFLTAA